MRTPLSHPFAEGECARKTGATEQDNPYPPRAWQHIAWQNGWLGLKESAATAPTDHRVIAPD
jgi:hypothetical protein